MKFTNDTQRIGFCETVFETTAEQSLDADISLPDYCPEIQRILKCSLIPNVTAVQNSTERITADVNAVVRLIYVGDNGKTAAYEQSYPIQKLLESGRLTPDSVVSVRVNTDYVNCRAVNSRRVDIRAMMTFIFKAQKKRDEDVLCYAEGAGMQTMKEDCVFASLVGLNERAFMIGEVVEITDNKLPISQIIDISVCAIADEVKIINNKALIKGECIVKIYYIGEEIGSIESIEHSMPISQIVDMEGIDENCLSSIKLSVTSCDASPKTDTSGEMRLIEVNARVSAFIAAFNETPLSLISDAYSTEYDVKNTAKSMELLKYNDSCNASFTNKVVLESIGVSVDCVLAVWCSDISYAFTAKEDKCNVAGSYRATVIYKDKEGQPGIIQKPVDFEFSIRLKESAERIVSFGSAVVSACSCAVTGDSRLELKTEILVNVLILSSTIKKHVNSIEVSQENSKREKSCALTIYFCEKGESIWNIAKHYNTTVDAVMCENDIVTDCIEKSGMLLIPGA